MKRIAILVVTVMLGAAAAAAPVHYFTQSQADRAVSYLNRQNEVMIYCGYDYEIETYVLVNEFWAEKVNSAFYELWIYGYDAYTGEEIYMPLELQCVWLYSAGRMYNAAQYLRFRTSGVHTPQITWYVPEYRPFTRVVHRPGHVRTYHYEVHRHGWMPPAPPAPHVGPGTPPPPTMHPYYMRQPHTPAPRPVAVWTPGAERPQVRVAESPRTDAPRSGATTVTSRPSGEPNNGSQTPPASTQRSGTATPGNTATTGSSRSNTTTNRNSGSTNTVSGRSGATTTTTSGSSRSGATTTGSSSTTSSRATTSTTPTRSNTRSGATTTAATTTKRDAATTTTSSPSRSGASTSRSTSSDKKSTTSSSATGSRNATSTARSSSTAKSSSTGSRSNTSSTRSSSTSNGSRNAGGRR